MTHPFHPLVGCEFELVTQKQAWGEERVYFRDKAKRLHHVPLGWTSVAPVDSFQAVADGRCRFRTEDLFRLADLVDGLATAKREARKDKYAADVKGTSPRAESAQGSERKACKRVSRVK